MVLDLSQIDFVDSSGLGALVQLAKQAQSAGGTSQIVTNARVTQTVKLVRLEQFLSLRPSVEAALENIQQSWVLREKYALAIQFHYLDSLIFHLLR